MTQIHSATLKVIQGGRITIPTEVRKLENIQEGDFVRVTIEKVTREMQRISVDVSKIPDRYTPDYHDRVIKYLELYIGNHYPGWIMNDLLQSQGSFTSDDDKEVFANFNIVRWV